MEMKWYWDHCGDDVSGMLIVTCDLWNGTGVLGAHEIEVP